MNGDATSHDCLSDPIHSLRESDYLSHRHNNGASEVFVIGIAGGSASGKTSVSE